MAAIEDWAPVGANHWWVRVNDMYDPMAAGGSEKPRDYTTLYNLYDLYLVDSGSVKVTFYNKSDTGVQIGCCLTNQSTSPASARGAMEKGKGFRLAATSVASQRSSHSVTFKWKLTDFYYPANYYNVTQVFGSSPGYPIILNMYGVPDSGNFTVQTFWEFKFHVICNGLKTISPDALTVASPLRTTYSEWNSDPNRLKGPIPDGFDDDDVEDSGGSNEQKAPQKKRVTSGK